MKWQLETGEWNPNRAAVVSSAPSGHAEWQGCCETAKIKWQASAAAEPPTRPQSTLLFSPRLILWRVLFLFLKHQGSAGPQMYHGKNLPLVTAHLLWLNWTLMSLPQADLHRNRAVLPSLEGGNMENTLVFIFIFCALSSVLLLCVLLSTFLSAAPFPGKLQQSDLVNQPINKTICIRLVQIHNQAGGGQKIERVRITPNAAVGKHFIFTLKGLNTYFSRELRCIFHAHSSQNSKHQRFHELPASFAKSLFF